MEEQINVMTQFELLCLYKVDMTLKFEHSMFGERLCGLPDRKSNLLNKSGGQEWIDPDALEHDEDEILHTIFIVH